jgi:hypothetical protein
MNLDDQENRAAIQEWTALLTQSRQQYIGKAKFPQLPQVPFDYLAAAARLKDESNKHNVAIEQAIAVFSRTHRWADSLTERDCFFLEWRVSFALSILGQAVLSDDADDCDNCVLHQVFAHPEIIAAVGADTDDFTKRMLIDIWDRFGEIYLSHWLAMPPPGEPGGPVVGFGPAHK